MKGRLCPFQVSLAEEERKRESPLWASLKIHDWLVIKLFHANLGRVSSLGMGLNQILNPFGFIIILFV